jgi:GT2 family glycosyltransferase
MIFIIEILLINMDSNYLKKLNLSEYYKALIKDKDIKIKSLQCQINTLELENTAIIKSLSFKVGSFVTFPFRFVLNLIIHKNKPKINPIKASCDSAFISSNYLEVVGWALSDYEISRVEVVYGVKKIIVTNLHQFREDVLKAFPKHKGSAKSGFELTEKISTIEDMVTLKIFDEKNNFVELEKVVIPAVTEMSLNSQYQIYLDQLANSDCFSELEYSPLISIIVPVFNVGSQWLDMCIQSVLSQTYINWQLCLYDDASTSQETLQCLQSWQNKDERIQINLGERNLGISLASNQAIKTARGEFVALLDHDDELTADALYEIVKCLNDNPELDFIYSDEDKIEADGSYCDPHFKTDFNFETLLSWNYICHFTVIRKSLGDDLGWFSKGLEGSQDYDLFLRAVSNTNNIHHIPKVLYHWRKIKGSTAVAIGNKGYALVASQEALEGYLHTNHIIGTVEPGLFPNSFRVRQVIDKDKLVSIIIPFREEPELLKSCIESIIYKTSYSNYEILLIDNQSINLEVIDYCKELTDKYQHIKYFQFNEEFNYSKINNWAVQQAIGDYILFLNNDIEVINTDWLEALLEPIQKMDVSAVGAKLLYEDNTIQHAGVVVNENSAVHVNKGLGDGENGYFQRSNYVQNVSACTAACLLVKKEVFLEVGGFDEELFKIAYNDVDLCLKMRQAGYLITYTPYAKLYHYESKSRGLDTEPEKLERFIQEIKNYQNKWGKIYKDGDPYFNPNLLPTSEKIMLNIKQ